MKITPPNLAPAAAVIAFLSLPMALEAQSIVSYEFGSRTTPISNSSSSSYNVPAFDASLGNLTGITLSLYERFDAHLDFENQNTGAVAYAALNPIMSSYWSSSELPDLENDIREALGFDDFLYMQVGIITIPAGGTFSNSYSAAREYEVDLSHYISNLTGNASSTFQLYEDHHNSREMKDLFPDVIFNYSFDNYVHGQITYTYAPVPEPSGILVATTGGLLALLRRKRRN